MAAGRTPDQIIAACKEESDHPTQNWHGMCLGFVHWVQRTPAAGAPDATSAWNMSKKKHTDKNAPKGYPVYWTGGGSNHGHVAVSNGDGRIWSSDIMRDGKIDLVDLDLIRSRWGLPYAGWTTDYAGTGDLFPVPDPTPAPSSDPTPTPEPTPVASLVRGADISAYQSVTDWTKVAGAVDFVIVKATEGQSGTSSTWSKYAAGAKAAGVLRGSYHFAHPENDPKADAANYVKALKASGFETKRDLPPCLDIESTGSKGKAALTAWCLSFLQEVDRLLGLEPGFLCGVYLNGNYWDSLLDGAAVTKGRFVFYASWPKGPWPTDPAKLPSRADIWQFTDDIAVAGISTQNPDGDVATEATLRKLAPLHYGSQPQPEEDVALTDADVQRILNYKGIENRNDPDVATGVKASLAWFISNLESTQDLQGKALDGLKTELDSVKAELASVGDGLDAFKQAVASEVATAVAQALSTNVVKVKVEVEGTPVQ